MLEGREITVDEAVTELGRDRPFYATSGGGVTLSGGEPLAQPAFSAAVLERCRAEGLHTCLDTSGQAPWADLERAVRWTDLVLYDFKIADPVRHRDCTGAVNDLILENLGKAEAAFLPLGGAGELYAGYKGYGLATMVEILSASLCGGMFMKDLLGFAPDGSRRPYMLGHFFLAIDVAHFLPLDLSRQITGRIMRGPAPVPAVVRAAAGGRRWPRSTARRWPCAWPRRRGSWRRGIFPGCSCP